MTVMNDDELRTLIREAIARHLGAPGVSPGARPAPAVPAPLSFHRYAVPRVSDDGMCLIEPAVRCNHCGYCECHGH
jgi:hypothetical protein